VLAEAGLDPTFLIGGKLQSAAQRPARQREQSSSRPTRATLLPAPEPGARRRHQIDADHMPLRHDLSGCTVPSSTSSTLPSTACRAVQRRRRRAASCAHRAPVPPTAERGRRPAPVQVQALAGGACSSPCSAAAPELPVTLNLAGVHNVRNALAAIAVAAELQLPTRRCCVRWHSSLASAAASTPRRAAGARRWQLHARRRLRHHPVEMAACWPPRGAFRPAPGAGFSAAPLLAHGDASATSWP